MTNLPTQDQLDYWLAVSDMTDQCREFVIAAARELAAIREAGLTPERRDYINKVRNCVVFIEPEPDAGVKETQAAFDELLSVIDSQAAVIDSLTAEVARLKDLLRRADVYVVAHIVCGKGALEEQQEARDDDDDGEGEDLREIVDDINEAEAVRVEIHKAIAPAAEGGSPYPIDGLGE